MHQGRAGGATRHGAGHVALAAIAAVVVVVAGCTSGEDSDTDPPTSAPLAPLLTTTMPGGSSASAPDGSTPAGSDGASVTQLPPSSGSQSPSVPGDGDSSSTSGPPASASTSATTTAGPPTLPPTTSSTTTTTSTTLLPTTTTTIVTQGATVLVANATDVQGAAGRLSQQLRERGFAVSDPTNAAGYEEYLEVTKVYAVPEAEAVARSVALLLGGVPITQMPIPAPIVGATAALGETGVLVMLGADRARIGIPAP